MRWRAEALLLRANSAAAVKWKTAMTDPSEKAPGDAPAEAPVEAPVEAKAPAKKGGRKPKKIASEPPVLEAAKPEHAPVVEAAKVELPPVAPVLARNGGDQRTMAAKVRVLLVAWGQSRATDWAEGLSQAGYDVHVETSQRASAFQWASEHQPAAVVIDLSTQPDDGRRLASTLKVTGATAAIPVLFSDAAESGRAPLTSVDALLGTLSKI